MTRIAIIGAGLAGLTLARQLNDLAEITVLEKSGGLGGRMATRSAPPYAFDHGAQFFTAKSPEFQSEVATWLEAGVVRSWNIRFREFERDQIASGRDWDDDRPHYVGVPSMSQIGKHLTDGLNIELNTTVASLEKNSAGWLLTTTDDQHLGPFDWVVATAPAAQTKALLGEYALAEGIAPQGMLGCCALMLGFPDEALPDIAWQAALVREADISWVSVNSSKPGRSGGYSIVVHSTNAYAEASLNEDAAVVKAHLLGQLQIVTGIDVSTAEHCDLHRWRYANIPQQTGEPALLDVAQQLGACGDWLIHGRVEAAFLSALRLARLLRAEI